MQPTDVTLDDTVQDTDLEQDESSAEEAHRRGGLDDTAIPSQT